MFCLILTHREGSTYKAKKGQSRRSLGTDGSARERDPIKLLENNMRNYKLMSDEKMEAIDAEEEDRAQKIYEEADKAPFPDPSEVYDDVYTDMEPEKGH